MDQQRSRAAVTPTTTKHAPPTPGQAAEPEPVVTGCLYEAGFSTTGPHPQAGVAIARSMDDARRRLADLLIFCDPHRGRDRRPHRLHSQRTPSPGTAATVAELFADFTTGVAGPVHARPLVALTTPRTADGR